MISSKRVVKLGRVTAVVLALSVALGSGTALAGSSGGSLDGQIFDVCGKWVFKTRNFGKQKILDYGWVPEFYRGGPTNPDFDEALLDVRMQFFFGLPGPPLPGFGPGAWFATIPYPDQTGNAEQFVVTGTYETRGQNVDLFVDNISDLPDPDDPDSPNTMDSGVDVLEAVWEEFLVNQLFYSRDLVTGVTFAVADRPERVRIKGRVNRRGDQLKVKLKMKLNYDIQFEITSTRADQFGVPGRLNLKGETKTCR